MEKAGTPGRGFRLERPPDSGVPDAGAARPLGPAAHQEVPGEPSGWLHEGWRRMSGALGGVGRVRGVGLKKLRPLDQAVGGVFDAFGQLVFRPPDSIEEVVEVPRRCPDGLGKVVDVESSGEKAILESHERECNSETLPAQAQISHCGLLPQRNNAAMSWPQVGIFKIRLKEYQGRTGRTQVQVADDLGTTYGTLRFWLSGTRPPNRENLHRAATVFGCSITDFIDDPGADVPGYGEGEGKDLSVEEKADLRAMGTDLSRLSPEQRPIVIRTWRALVDGFLKTNATLELEVLRAPKVADDSSKTEKKKGQ